MDEDFCLECKENPVTMMLEISDRRVAHLCPSCFNQIMTDLMALDLKEFEIKEFAFKDTGGDQYNICIENLGYPMGLDYEIRHSINDGSEHHISMLGRIQCGQKDIWNQMRLNIEATVNTRYLTLFNRPFGDAQAQLIGDEVVGKIEYDHNRYDEIPKLIIDGNKYSWKEFGRMLSSSGGLQFKLKIYEEEEEEEVKQNTL